MDTTPFEPVCDVERFADGTPDPEAVLRCEGRSVAGGLSGGPVPRQQRVQLACRGAPGDDALEHVGEPGHRIDAVEPGRLNQGHRDRPVPRPAVGSREQGVLARQHHCGVILPMSGRKSLSTIVGTRCMAAVSALNIKSDEPMAT